MKLKDCRRVILDAVQKMSRDREAKHLIHTLLDQASIPILENIQGMLGEEVRLTGTMGSPIELEPWVQIINDKLNEVLFQSCADYCVTPYNNEYLRSYVLSHYLYVFARR